MENKATQTYDLDEKKRHWKINESDIYDSQDHKNLQLLEELRKLPDFDRYPFPSSWYKKYNLKPLEAVDMKTYLNSGGIMKAITEALVHRMNSKSLSAMRLEIYCLLRFS